MVLKLWVCISYPAWLWRDGTKVMEMLLVSNVAVEGWYQGYGYASRIQRDCGGMVPMLLVCISYPAWLWRDGTDVMSMHLVSSVAVEGWY